MKKSLNNNPAKLKITGPTYLTILRILLSIPFAIFLYIPETWSRTLALTIFVVASLTDHIDGRWARDKKIVTSIGAFLDPLADKILINLAFLVLTYLNMIPLWVFAVILVRDFTVDGMRMSFARAGTTISASIYGKLKTTFQMIALIIIQLDLILNITPLYIIGNIFLYLSLALTVFSGIDYLLKGFKKVF